MMNNINIQAEASAIMLQAVTAITGQAQDEPTKDNCYKLSSGLLPCCCVAMYNTIISPENIEQNLNDGEEEFCYCTINFDDYKKTLAEAAQDYINDNIIDSLRNYGLINIEAMGISSPKYYNYSTDELIMAVTMVEDWKTIMQEKIDAWRGCNDVERYIAEHWHSYSGYINFMPESLDDVLTEDNERRQLAAYLTLAMVAEGCIEDADTIMEDLYYRMDDFSDYKRINVLAEYYNSEAEADRMAELWNDDTKWNDLYWDLRHKVGEPWRKDDGSRRLSGIEDSGYIWQADSEGKRLLFWAVKNHLTVNDLYRMAA